MRVAPAISRSYVIDTAFIILQVEELARFCLIHPVPVTSPLLPQPFCFKFIHRHTKMGRYSFQVLFIERRGHGFTTVGTGKAICFLPNLFFHTGYLLIQPPGCFFFQPAQKTPHPAFVLHCFFAKNTYINGFHINHAPKIQRRMLPGVTERILGPEIFH